MYRVSMNITSGKVIGLDEEGNYYIHSGFGDSVITLGNLTISKPSGAHGGVIAKLASIDENLSGCGVNF